MDILLNIIWISKQYWRKFVRAYVKNQKVLLILIQLEIVTN
jgi:hypothetical protein